MKICICGGGSLGHVLAGYLAAQGNSVNMLTTRPEQWSKTLEIDAVDGRRFVGHLSNVSANPADVIPEVQVVLLCLPGYAIKGELKQIKEHLDCDAFVGSVFSSTGFFFEAQNILPTSIPLFGFQRVPFIARTAEYGCRANLLGYKNEHKIAIERATAERAEMLRQWWEDALQSPVKLLTNYLEASLTNSNPLLHTARLYTMFRDWNPYVTYPRMILFYEEWTEEAAETYIQMDNELARLLEQLPVTPGFLPSVLDYYESTDAFSLSNKLSSIASFKGITSPMKQDERGEWVPDFQSRYFTEDFGYSLRYIYELAQQKGIHMPVMERVYRWGAQYI